MLTSFLRRSLSSGGLAQGLVVLVLTVVAYLGVYGTSFASEDFILLGRLEQSSALETFVAEASGPWLGLEHVNFYRPVAMALLVVETTLFGLNPFVFHLAHVLLHGFNALLVLWIVGLLIAGREEKDSSSLLPLAVAALFALYPLHPSAVLFVGSFATLWGATFQLLALGYFLCFVLTGYKGSWISSLAAFLAALGSYEAAVVLPAVLASGGLVLWIPGESPGASRRGLRNRLGTAPYRSLLGILPFAGALVVYLLVRKAALGVVLGGYPSIRARWLEQVGRLTGDFLVSLPRLLLPEMERAPSRSLLLWVALVALILVAIVLWRRRAWQGRLVVVSLFWVAILQLPFSFVGVVPASGRFWYLPSFAMALGVCAFLHQVVPYLPTRRAIPRHAWVVPILALIAVYGFLLRRDLGAYRAADEQVRGIQRAVLGEASQGRPESLGGQQPLVVAGLPEFVPNGRGLPVAKIFQHGFHDAVNRPFLQATTEAFPVPAFVARDRLLPLAKLAGGRAVVWDQEALRLHPPARRATPEESITAKRQGMQILFRCPGCATVRFFAVTRGGAFRGDPEAASLGTLAVPERFLRGMSGLYSGPVLWWLEGERRGAEGHRVGGPGSGERVVSEIHRLESTELFPDLALRFGRGPRGAAR